MFAAALIVRFAVWLQTRSIPIVRSPQLDSLEYLEWARRIAGGNFAWPSPPAHGPGYPYFLGLILAATNGSLSAAAVVQAVLGAAGCVLIAMLARAFFGRTTGLLAGLLLALDGLVAFVDISLLSEGLLLVLACAALLAIGPRGASAIRSVTCGTLIGLAALVRPAAIFLLPVAAAVVLARASRNGGPKARWLRGAGFASLAAGAAAVVILPAILANVRAAGAPLFVQGHGGFNFWIGNSPARDGLPSVRPGAGWDRLEGEAVRAGFVRPADQDRYFVRKTIGEIRNDPSGWALLLGAKLVRTLQAAEIRDPFSFAFFQHEAPLLRWLPGFAVLFPFALLGGISAAVRSPRPWLLFGAAAAWIGSCVLLVTSFRYRLPLIPLIAIFAAFGLVELVRVRRSSRRLAGSAAIVLAGVVASHLVDHPASRNFAEEWSATGFALNHERDLAGAERAFHQSIAADAAWSPAWAGLGVVAANRGADDAAIASLAKAVSLEPDSVFANLELARLLARRGRVTDAEASYRRVLRVAPAETAALDELGALVLQEGRASEAATILRDAARTSPDDPKIQLLLARALAADHRWEEAEEAAARAAGRDTGNGEAWFTLAMIRIDGGNARGAEEALERARLAGADPRRVGVARALALRALGQIEAAREALRGVLAIDPQYGPARKLLSAIGEAAPNR